MNLFTAFGYLESDKDDQKVLYQVAKALRPNGEVPTIDSKRYTLITKKSTK